MKVHVAAIGNHPLAHTVSRLGADHGRRHVLVDSPGESDLILLCGSFTRDFDLLLGHPLYGAFPRKSAVYSGDDAYCPLVPGVYCSARSALSTRSGRVRTHAYASSYGLHGNAAVAEASRDLGVERSALKGSGAGDLLFSFEGSATSKVRKRLFGMGFGPGRALVRDTSRSYSHFDRSEGRKDAEQQTYLETMLRSSFVLCPRGEGTGTLRLFEAMSLGLAPVLISDRYVLPRGPRWSDFLVRVREREVSQLVPLLEKLAFTSASRGALARETWLEWFAPDVLFDGLVDAAHEALVAGAVLNAVYRRASRLFAKEFQARRGARRVLGRAAVRFRR